MINPKNYQHSSKESYTEFPNRYNDLIRAKLTDTQRDVCEAVIRQTYGWHRASGRISNKTFVNKSGKSERAVITAKKQLIKMGLLVMLEAPIGTKAGLYMLDIHYENHIRPQITQEQINQLIDEVIKKDEIFAEFSTNDPELTSGNPTQPPEEIAPEPHQIDQPISEAQPNDQDLKSPEPKIEINRDIEKVREIPSTEVSSALDIYIYINNNNLNNKQTKQETTKAKEIKIVRSSFHKLFPDFRCEPQEEFRSFANLIKKFGVEKCLEKLEIIRDYRKGRHIDNPMALFVSSLHSDYTPPARVRIKMKADKCSQNEIEKWKEKHEQMKDDYKKHDLRKQKVDEFLSSAAPEERQALEKQARAELLEQGSNPMFINDFVINQKIIEMINRENLACK